MREVPIVFRVHGTKVSGVLHLPSGRGKPPAVVMCHGFTGNKMEAHFMFVKTARALCASGIAAFRFDCRGSGESGGKFEHMTVPGEIADARGALSLVSRHRAIDSRRIGIMGLSLGGMVAANAAARESCVRSLALWCATADPHSMMKRIKSWGGGAIRIGRLMDIGGLGVGAVFFRNPGGFDPVKALQKCCRPFPVLVLKGEADPVITMEENSLYIRGLRTGTHPVKQVVIPGAGHTFERLAHEREAIRITTDWFKRTL